MSARTAASLLPAAALATLLSQQPLPRISCAIAPDQTAPIALAAGRVAYCGLDLGSRSVKLSVVSMVPGSTVTMRDERLCRRTLGMGAQVFDVVTGTAKSLPAGSIDDLAATIKEFQAICQLDHATVASAAATQWARDATNIAEVRSRVKAATGVDFNVLSPAQEAEFGYAAAALNAPGHIVVDPGSNSFQISWQPKTSSAVRSVLIEYGYVRGSSADFEPAPDYPTGAANYRAKAKTKINEALGRASPPADLAAIAALVRAGELGPELISPGQDGAIHWAVRGLLRENGLWITDPKTYDARIARPATLTDPSFGLMAAMPIELSELQAFARNLSASDFKALSTDPIKGMYGQRALATPVLMELLMSELGLRRLVIVPQETTTGHILARLAK